MKNPQLENGYVKIANEISEQFAQFHLSGNEWKILWTILRKTWGWNKKEDAISLTQFEKLTGLSRPSVKEAIDKLVGKKVLVVGKKVLGVNVYSFNKLYSQWVVPKKVLVGFSVKVVPKKVPKLVGKKEHTKDNKDNITKDILLRNTKSYGDPLINEIKEYFLTRMSLPKEDCSVKQSRQYWQLLLRESKTGLEGVKWLVNLASKDEFYRNNITSGKDLYYKRIKIISRKRGNKPKFATMEGGDNDEGIQSSKKAEGDLPRDVENNDRDKTLLANK